MDKIIPEQLILYPYSKTDKIVMDKVTESKRIRIRDRLNDTLGLTFKRQGRWNLIITEDDNRNQVFNLFKPNEDLYFYTIEELENYIKELINKHGKNTKAGNSSTKVER